MGFGLTSRLRLEEPGEGGRNALVRRLGRHVDWLFSRDLVLDILTCAATTVVLAFLLDLGKTAVWIGAALSPIVGREVRHLGRNWSRRRNLSLSALLALVSGYKQGVVPLDRIVDPARHWITGQLAPAAAASAITIAGVTATQATLGEPSTFFGGHPTIAAISFYDNDARQTRARPGGTLRACGANELAMVFDGGGADEGTAWKVEVMQNGKRWNESASTWPGGETHTLSARYTRDGEPTGEDLPSGLWALRVSVGGDVVSESSVTLVNNAC